MSADPKTYVAALLGIALVGLVSRRVFKLLQRREPKVPAIDPNAPWNHVTFAQRGLSKDYDAEEERTRLFGRILSKLTALSPQPPVAEDWGSTADVHMGERRFLLGFGHVGDLPEQWLLFVEPSGASQISTDDTALRAVLEAVNTALREEPAFRDVRWHRADHWAAGKTAMHRTSPTG